METLDLLLLPGGSATDFFYKYHRRIALRKLNKAFKALFMGVLTMAFVLGYSSIIADTYIVSHFHQKLTSLEEIQRTYEDISTKEVSNLARLTRYVSNQMLGENEALRYAGLIYHASKLYDIEPLEVIALVAAESSFISSSINKKTGDYGLGQVNWKYWGKSNGLTPQELLDPAINVVMTCHIYKHYGEDFSKYHRGNGIKSQAYLVNIQSILSSLRAHAKESNIQ